jgi:AcrR family transcriptional regulator
MMREQQTDARERVLNTAELLFNERGYTAVSMRDIAHSLDMRQASLYYHVPQGKEQLFVEVAERTLERHHEGLNKAIAAAPPQMTAQLRAAAGWFTANLPLRLLSMLETDMAAISEEQAARLVALANEALFAPVTRIFTEAAARGEIRPLNPQNLAGNFLAMMDGISYSSTSGHTPEDVADLVDQALDLFLNGVRPH